MNTSFFQTTTIAALEAMEVPIEFAEARFADVLKKQPEQSVSRALIDEEGHFKKFAPVAAIIGVGSTIIGWVMRYFQAKEITGIKEDLRHVKINIIKITNNQRLLFATTVKHQEILANHSLLWVQNQHRWADLYTTDQASILTKVQQHSLMVQ